MKYLNSLCYYKPLKEWLKDQEALPGSELTVVQNAVYIQLSFVKHEQKNRTNTE